jgi:hypothetical protein
MSNKLFCLGLAGVSGMFKPITLVIVCLTVMPIVQPSQAMADNSTLPLSAVVGTAEPLTNPPADLLYAQIMRRSPESIERERFREQHRRGRRYLRRVRNPNSTIEQRRAFRRQLEWRRRYGDLAPRRHRRFSG